MKYNRLIFKYLIFNLVILLLLLGGCRKNEVTSNSTIPAPTSQSLMQNYLGQYTITEVGSKLYPLPYPKYNYCGTDKLSYHPGDSVSLYITGPKAANQLITMTDANNSVILSVTVPIDDQTIKNTKPWVDGLGLDKTTTIKLPQNLKSGVYKWAGNNPIVVESSASIHDITIVYPSNTDNAYNYAGGKSLYGPDITDRSTVVSSKRFIYNLFDVTSSFFSWMNLQSYDANYITDSDLDDYQNIQNSKLVIITGHSEYWSRQARENIDKFVANGKNVLILSGNTMWWQVRYNLTKDLMICYKDNNIDPLTNTPYSTVTWTTRFLNYPPTSSIGVDFLHGGYGDQLPGRWDGYKIAEADSPLFEGTGLNNGDILTLPTHEYDGAPLVKNIEPGSTEIPIIDNSKLNFYKIELLGYDFAVDGTGKGVATFIVFKKTQASGTVVNVASENWCSKTGIGGADKVKIEQITKNMIEKSLNNQSLLIPY